MTKRYHQAVLASCEIPWDENGELIESVFREEVRHTISAGFNDLYIFGTAGEGYAVTLTQFNEIVGIFREETSGDDVHPMVGVIGGIDMPLRLLSPYRSIDLETYEECYRVLMEKHGDWLE